VSALKRILFLLFLVIGFISCSDDDEGCDLSPNLNVDQSQLDSDLAIIDAYLLDNNINAVEDESGIQYVITSEGTGEMPSLCNAVTVNYVGSLLSNGDIFDETSQPVTFALSDLITGWQIGIPKIRSGGSITLYVPSVFAYGSRSVGSIPPNSNLIFDIELTGVQ